MRALVHQHLLDDLAGAHHLVGVVGRPHIDLAVLLLELFEDVVVAQFLGPEELERRHPRALPDHEHHQLPAGPAVPQFEPQIVGEAGVPERAEFGAERLPVHRIAGFHGQVRQPGIGGDQVVALDQDRLDGLFLQREPDRGGRARRGRRPREEERQEESAPDAPPEQAPEGTPLDTEEPHQASTSSTGADGTSASPCCRATSFPSSTTISTGRPGPTCPVRTASESGSSTCFWSARRNGRAP